MAGSLRSGAAMKGPTHPIAIPPLHPDGETITADRDAEVGQLRRELEAVAFDERQAAHKHCGAARPNAAGSVPSWVHESAEPLNDLAEPLEQVHAQRLGALLDIYACRQAAAGKPMKKLSGRNFWMAGQVLQKPTASTAGAKFLLADAVGQCFWVLADWFPGSNDANMSRVRCLLAHEVWLDMTLR